MDMDRYQKFLGQGREAGLLAIRLGVGFFFYYVHGLPKLVGGAETWTKLGGAMANFGITSAPVFWGLLSALAECVGGALVGLGLLTRPAAAALTFNMLVAATMHLSRGDGLAAASHAAELMFVCLGLVLAGAGRWSLDQLAFKGRF